MQNKTRQIALWALLLLSLAGTAQAQNGFNIPYSQFGLGESCMSTSLPYAYSMGGVVYSRATRNVVNPFNPASYAAVETESFVFDLGMNVQTCTLRQGDNTLRDADGNISHVAIAFPITRWWKTAAGIMPYSDVSYESVYTSTDPFTLSDVKTIYAGNGGATQIFWGNAFNIGKRLSVGFNLDYLYGTITRAITYDFQGSDTTYAIDSRRQKNTYISNLVFDLGLQYRQPLGERHTLNIGLTCRTPRTMQVDEQALVYTYFGNNTSEYLLDTIFPAQGQSDTYQSTLEQPLTLGLGLALERNNRWQIAIDGYYSPFSGIKYTENPSINIFGQSALHYADNYRLALGGEWMGNPDASSYWGRIGVRAGIFCNRGRLALGLGNDEYSLNEIGGGLGLSLPMRKGRSVLGISLGYSSFGRADLLRRDCLTIGISIGSCERWFSKRKYD